MTEAVKRRRKANPDALIQKPADPVDAFIAAGPG